MHKKIELMNDFVLDKQLKKDERKSTNFLPKIRYM